MDTKEYFVRVCFQNKFKFVKLEENELNWRVFIDKGKEKDKFNIVYRFSIIIGSSIFSLVIHSFDFKIGSTSAIYLKDNLGVDIPQDFFEGIIRSYHSGSNFYIHIDIKPSKNCLELVTPFVSYTNISGSYIFQTNLFYYE